MKLLVTLTQDQFNLMRDGLIAGRISAETLSSTSKEQYGSDNNRLAKYNDDIAYQIAAALEATEPGKVKVHVEAA